MLPDLFVLLPTAREEIWTTPTYEGRNQDEFGFNRVEAQELKSCIPLLHNQRKDMINP
jgi:hypothetical protein